jgi:CheY-like chemotaxis protein
MEDAPPMRNKILWLDNDLAYIEPYVEILRESGFEVNPVPTITQAEDQLKGDYDLLILDIMIPTKTEQEEQVYRPERTEAGRKTGLAFYTRMKQALEEKGCRLLVLTVRLDESIFEEFLAAGLPRECYDTKMTLREAPIFLERVKDILAKPGAGQAQRDQEQ